VSLLRARKPTAEPYADLNLATTVESREELYWDTSDRLINRVTTPDASWPTANIVDVYAHIEPAAVGSIRLDYTYAGPFERWLYDIRDPVGLPIVRYEVVYPGGDSTAVWSGAWTPFGELESETGDATMRPPWGFTGQLTLAGSESRELRLNQWRVYDPEVGQYVTPEPLAVSGETPVAHGYGYAYSSPHNYTDPSGENPIAIAAAAAEGLAALAGPFVVAACVTGLIYAAVESGANDVIIVGGSGEADADECYSRYVEQAGYCGETYTDTYRYDLCMKNAWGNYIRCLNGHRPQPLVPR